MKRQSVQADDKRQKMIPNPTTMNIGSGTSRRDPVKGQVTAGTKGNRQTANAQKDQAATASSKSPGQICNCQGVYMSTAISEIRHYR